MKRVYLDWASAAPVSPNARRVFMKALETFGNPSSPHAEGVAARAVLEDARKRIAKLAGTKAESIIFTSGATEANNLAIRGSIEARAAAGSARKDLHVLYLPTAHASVIETLHDLSRDGVQIEAMKLADGAIDRAALAAQVRPETVLVCMDLVCGETGIRYDTRDIRRILDAARNNARDASRITLHVDASQAPFVDSFEHTHLGGDFITLDAQKVGGVRGIGVLIRPSTLTPLAPITTGGGQEDGFRPGTEQPALAAAFATALEEVQSGRADFLKRAHTMREELIQKFSSIPEIVFHTGKEQAPHILNVSLLGRDTDYLVMLLSQKGFSVATKSACETDAEGSRAVLALTNDAAQSRATLRISWGPMTKASELASFARALATAVEFLDANALTTA